MATNYAKDRLATAIKNHLLSVDVIPPTTEVSKLAGELAQVCLTELDTGCYFLGRETIEKLFAPSTLKVKTNARGVE